MDGLTLTTAAAAAAAAATSLPFPFPLFQHSPSSLRLHHRRRNFSLPRLSSSRDLPPELDEWDRMELHFGLLLGEDPELTLAKVIGRKVNPDASCLDIERSFKSKGRKKKKKGADAEDRPVGVPLDWDVKHSEAGSDPRASNSLVEGSGESIGGSGDRSSIARPGKEGKIVENVGKKESADSRGVLLRKRVQFPGTAVEKPPESQEVPSLLLSKTGRDGSGEEWGLTLSARPQVARSPQNKGAEVSAEVNGSISVDESKELVDWIKSVGPENDHVEEHMDDAGHASVRSSDDDRIEDASSSSDVWDSKHVQDLASFPLQATLMEKPLRSDLPTAKKISELDKADVVKNEVAPDAAYEMPESTEQGEYEESDWRMAEELLQTGEIVEVELVSCSNRGFVVSFGSLAGFLPYRNFGLRLKFLAFESWLRRKGLDPSLYRQNLSIVRSYDVQNVDSLKENTVQEYDTVEGGLHSGMKFEELLDIYNQEKLRFLKHFLGQRIRASVVLVDRDSRKIFFSGRPKEKEGVLDRKRLLMTKLSVGEILKCRIRKIVYYGIFVEVNGVLAFIHQTEIPWDIALNPSSFFKVGQIIDAKVHQLDFVLERITLSLKEITPDILNEALEPVIGGSSSLGSIIETSPGDAEVLP